MKKFALLVGLWIWSFGALWGQLYITNGNALNQGGCYRLTADQGWQGGSVWYLNKVNINESFDLYFDIFLGCKDADGADGIAFVLQPISTNIGSQGGGLGYQGVSPSVAIELDTWQNPEANDPLYDHISIQRNGNVAHGGANSGTLSGPVPILPAAANIEDCNWHKMRVTWIADSNTLRAYIDCNLTISYTGDIVANVFGGDSLVFWGFTGATGGFWNEHRFCLDYISFTEAQRDTAICQGQSVPLSVGTGSSFLWSPYYGLDDSTAQNPIASPDTTTTYTVTVTDVCGQQRFDTVTVFVSPDTVLDVLPDQLALCGPGQPLDITANTFPFSQFLWSTGDTTATTTVSQPGNYTVTVTNFCRTFTDNVVVTTRPPVNLLTQDVDCFGSTTGAASLTHTGTAPYQTTWYNLSTASIISNQTSSQVVSNVNNLGPGFYVVVSQDAAGCRDTVSFQIAEPPQLQLQVLSATNLTCFGDNSGIINVQATGGGGQHQYSINGSSFQPSGTFSNLPAGTYTITATDQNGCLTTQSVTLTQPPQIGLAVVVQKNVDCFGSETGAVTVNATQGIVPYQFRLGNGPLQISPEFTGLAAGTWQIEVQDINGCTNQIPVNITEPPAIQVSADIVNVDCNGDLSGAISVSALGGVPGYQYAISGGAFSGQNSFTSLGAGMYQVLVRDDSACVDTSMIQVLEPNALTPQPLISDVLCFGDTTGFAVMLASGGWGGYTYSVNGGPFAPLDTLTGLSAGLYQISVQDDSLCTASVDIQVNEPPLLEIFVNDRIDVDCLGNNTGTLAVSAVGGTPGYLFTRDDGLTTQPSGTFDNLFGGIYTLTVLDLNGCEASVDTFLATPTGLSGGVDQKTNVACFGDSTGELQLTAFGGTGPYRYALNGDTITGTIFSGLPAMTDTLVLVDDNGCIIPIPFTITEPPLLQVGVTDTRDLACFGIPNGEIRLEGTGGTKPYSYSIGQGNQSQRLFTQVSAGTYQAMLTDVNGCEDSLLVTLAEPPQLVLDTALLRHVRCFGESNGEIRTTATGGSGDLFFQLDTLGWAQASTWPGLSGGSYLVQVRDDSLCLDSLMFIVEEPDSLILTLENKRDIACFTGNTGEIHLSATGGRQPWGFSLNGGNLQPDSSFFSLLAGPYVVGVVDDSLCVDTVQVRLNQPPPLSLAIVSQTDVRCFGEGNGEIVVAGTGGVRDYTYALNGQAPVADSTFSRLNPGTYRITITDDSACVFVLNDIRVEEPALLEAFPDYTEVRCFGESNGQAWVNVTNGNGGNQIEWFTNPIQVGDTARGLVAGTYGVRVEDSLGCEAAAEITVTEPDLLVMSLDSIREAYCDWENGGAWLSSVGGTPEYIYEWPGLAINGPAAVDVLGVPYFVTVRDSRGCEDTMTVSIPNTPPAVPAFLTIPDNSTPILQSVGEIMFLNQSEGAVTYLWEFGDGNLSDATDPAHLYEEPGDYQVVLTAWNAFFVCPTTVSATITIIPDGQLFYPNAFSPNGDGRNDVFFIKGEGIVEVEIMVFDRWGRLITTWNDLSVGWDGRVPGSGMAQEGVYTFVVRATTNAGERIEHGGTITLLK